MEEHSQNNLTENLIEETIQKPKRKTKPKSIVKSEIVEKQKKKSFVIADYSKEYEWTLTDEIEQETPLKFIFTLATNKELANYNDNLMRIEGNSVVTYQNLVDIELVNLKLIRIENIELNGEIKTIIKKSEIENIIDKVLDLDIINELSGYIRVMSTHKGKLI